MKIKPTPNNWLQIEKNGKIHGSLKAVFLSLYGYTSDADGIRHAVIEGECSGQGFAWITEGREIENYLNCDKVKESVIAVHPSASQIIGKDKWANLLKYKKEGSKNERTANKVKVAKHYVKNNDVNFNVFDLNERMDELCDFILKANGNKI